MGGRRHGLSNKQRAWIREYLVDWNATQAAIRAGYSPRTAASIGSENLRKPEIAAEIARYTEEHALKPEECLLLLAGQARSNLGAFLRVEDGRIRLDLTTPEAQGQLHLIESFKQTRYGTEIRLYSAQDALFKLGMALGVLKEQIALSGPVQMHVVYDDDSLLDSAEQLSGAPAAAASPTG